MSSVESAVRVSNLTKYYGELLAVDHISFEVKKGELFGFLGPNGAGKTTTIRMLTGVIKRSEGEAQVMGYPAGSVAAKQLSGVMPELSNAYLDLTGWGNLMLVGELYRVPGEQAKKRAETLLRELGLFDRKDSKASDYSMGMRKRLILCMGLLPNPEILFLDEPTSGLDVQSARFMRGMLRGLKGEGKTIFLTTHNMDEAAEMCDRVAIINRGKIVALDSPSNLSITAGRVFLVDVSFEIPAFDRPVGSEELSRLPGVSRVETAQAIEQSDRLRMQTAMAGLARARMQSNAGGGGPTPAMMRRMQRVQQDGGPSPEMMRKMQESSGTHPDAMNMRKLIEEDGGPTPEMRDLMAKIMQEGGPSPEGRAEMMKLIEERKRAKTAPEASGTVAETKGTRKPESARFRLYTEDTTLLVTSLVDFTRANSVKMTILNVRSPSLEDAFIRLTEEKSREK